MLYIILKILSWERGDANVLKKILRFVIALLGGVLGFSLNLALSHAGIINFTGYLDIFAKIGFSVIFAILFYLITPTLIKGLEKIVAKMELELSRVPARDVVFGSFGLIFGLILSYFISLPIKDIQIPYISGIFSLIITIVLYIVLGYLGIKFALKSSSELVGFIGKSNKEEKNKNQAKDNRSIRLLDTSSIIDGRIKKIIELGFLDGELLVPNFVLLELQNIADSSDDIRRTKGRRGLDILDELKENKSVNLSMTDKDYKDIKEVDTKLMRLAKELGASIITTDYNLNKVSQLQSIKILNINELALSLKPDVLHGEHISVEIVKEGKEHNQGLAYLDDGTMIVVEDGKNYIGKRVDTVVTSILQTAAGKMIFVRVDE